MPPLVSRLAEREQLLDEICTLWAVAVCCRREIMGIKRGRSKHARPFVRRVITSSGGGWAFMFDHLSFAVKSIEIVVSLHLLLTAVLLMLVEFIHSFTFNQP